MRPITGLCVRRRQEELVTAGNDPAIFVWGVPGGEKRGENGENADSWSNTEEL